LDWVHDFVDSEGRVVSHTFTDDAHPNCAISEGQSYAMLMSVLNGDRKNFDAVWRWTQKNMQRPDFLFDWQAWTPVNAQDLGRVNEIATDGDELIAYALLKAHDRWGGDYQQEAQKIIGSLWKNTVVQYPALVMIDKKDDARKNGAKKESYQGHFYLSSGIVGHDQKQISIDSAYLMPYAYREFAKVDKVHRQGWNQLANDAYNTIDACAKLHEANLPPNWAQLDMAQQTLSFLPASSPEEQAQFNAFGYDSERVFWHAAIDARLGNSRAVQFLKSHTFLTDYLKRTNGEIPRGVWANQKVETGSDFKGDMNLLALAQMNIVDPAGIPSRLNPILLERLWPVGWKSYYEPAVQWFSLYSISDFASDLKEKN
jgi:endo-1,4-beta-D-glucanase Y